MSRDPEIVSFTMSHIRGRDTGIEKALRTALTSRGVHYRLYSKTVFGHPDIVIQKERIAIFCDSEFWHGYHFAENEAKIKTHRDYWIPKIKRNIARDEEVNKTLQRQGYLVLRFWGKEIEKDIDGVVSKIMEAIAKQERIRLAKAAISSFTTLCYIEKEDCYLFLHRVKKKVDVNAGKWIGVGGHLEEGESRLACLKREVKEETGLDVLSYRYLGKIDFLNSLCPPERMYLYKVTSFAGDLLDCDEGELAWIKKSEMMDLSLWEGDRLFLPYLDSEDQTPFSLDLLYEGDALIGAVGPYYPAKKKAKKKKKRKSHGTKENQP